MKNKNLALFLLVGLGAAGCSTNGPNGDDGDDGGDDAPPFTDGVSTLSGAAEPGYIDGSRGAARFSNPVNVAFGPDGMLYVADFDNGKIRVVDPETGATATTIAQQGFQRPFGMTFAPDGTLYVSTDRDPTGQHSLMTGTIWRVDVDARTADPVAIGIGRPRGLAFMPSGKIAIADYTHHVIQLVDPSSGSVALLAGKWDEKGMVDAAGSSARFSTPYGIVVRGSELVVADFDNHRLRIIGLDGTVSTFAGTGSAGFADGAAGSAMFNKPEGLAVADNGDLFVTDLENFRVRRVTNAGVETIAGNGQGGFLDSDDRLAAQLFGLEGVAVEPDGKMAFVADGGRGENVPYNRIRSIKL